MVQQGFHTFHFDVPPPPCYFISPPHQEMNCFGNWTIKWQLFLLIPPPLSLSFHTGCLVFCWYFGLPFSSTVASVVPTISTPPGCVFECFQIRFVPFSQPECKAKEFFLEKKQQNNLTSRDSHISHMKSTRDRSSTCTNTCNKNLPVYNNKKVTFN